MSKLMLTILVIIGGYQAYKHVSIWYWKKKLRIKQHVSTFQNISQDINGFELSRQARASGDAPEYVYGEIDFTSCVALLSLTHPNHNCVFYDLGSGTGIAVFACAMAFDVKKSCGVELFDNLHQAAITQQQRLTQSPVYLKNATTIDFVCDNFLNIDLKDATLIFINASAFFGETWELLNQKLATLKQDLTVITTTKPLLQGSYVLLKTTKVQMSWGVVKAYVQQKQA